LSCRMLRFASCQLLPGFWLRVSTLVSGASCVCLSSGPLGLRHTVWDAETVGANMPSPFFRRSACSSWGNIPKRLFLVMFGVSRTPHIKCALVPPILEGLLWGILCEGVFIGVTPISPKGDAFSHTALAKPILIWGQYGLKTLIPGFH